MNLPHKHLSVKCLFYCKQYDHPKQEGNIEFGLYCGGRCAYINEKCNGCMENKSAEKWCKTRKCCVDNSLASCANCTQFSEPKSCKIFYNVIARIVGWVFGSNRVKGIEHIKAHGAQSYAAEMVKQKRHAYKLKRF